MKLNEGWVLKGFELDEADNKSLFLDDNDATWLDAHVPGDVHSILIKHGIIEDPFYSTNDMKCLWVEDRIWWYRKKFQYDKAVNDSEKLVLTFNGLDTVASVYLNGILLGWHCNMFTPVSFDISDMVRNGENMLAVRFDTIKSAAENKDYSKLWIIYNRERAWIRKCSMNFGWDWSPRLVTAGIWQDVELELYKKVRINGVHVRTLSITRSEADVEVEIEVDNFSDTKNLFAKVSINLDGYTLIGKAGVDCNHAIIKLKIQDPHLWWTHDLGKPELYDVTVNLEYCGEIIDTYSSRFGIRTIDVLLKDEDGNNRFTFILNGIPVFAKGVNWVPVSNFIGSAPDEKYTELISMAKEANMNMLRIWGGGIYEKEIFYRTCDEFGIMVWQDFLFACSLYPDFDRDFMENVRNEIRHAVKRLRKYTCISIWCGNNENQWIHGMEIHRRSDVTHYGQKIYDELIPGLLKELGEDRFYWPGSPYGGNDQNSDEQGDKHSWQVSQGHVYPHWYGEPISVDVTPHGVSFKNYAKCNGKFISEFGIQASPVMETLKRNIPADEIYLGSFELDYRNKDVDINRGRCMLQGYTGIPADLEQYIDYSMLCQAQGLKLGIEHYRRRKPDCSGTLIWQLNDSWPGIGWSLIDHYLFPKASYYFAKRFYSPILISFKEEEGDKLSVWVTNDTMQQYSDILTVGVKNFMGLNIFEEKFDVKVRANSSLKVKEFAINFTNSQIVTQQRRWLFIYVRPDNENVYSNEYFFMDHKDLVLPKCNLQIKAENSDSMLFLNIRTDNFARFVKIECPVDGTVCNDNYFNIYPGEEKSVTMTNFKGNIFSEQLIAVNALNSKK